MIRSIVLLGILFISHFQLLAQTEQNQEVIWNSKEGVHATYQLNNYDDPIFDRDSLYIPVKNGKKVELHIAACSAKTISRIYYPSKSFAENTNFAIEDGFIYYHSTSRITKVEMATHRKVWSADYDGNYAAQWEPYLVGKYAIAITSDRLLVVEKATGKQIRLIKGRNFEEAPSLSDGNLIYAKFNGTVICMNLQTGKELWKIDVGESSGFGSLTDGDNIYLPSWSARFYCLNKRTGKSNWVLNLDKIKNGCGSGFEEVPVMVNNRLYAPHRDEGFFVLDKNNGKLIQNIETDNSSESIVGGAIEYKNHIVYASDRNLYIYSIEANTLVHRIPLPTEFRSEIYRQGNYVVIANKGYYKLKPIVVVYDLNKFIAN